MFGTTTKPQVHSIVCHGPATVGRRASRFAIGALTLPALLTLTLASCETRGGFHGIEFDPPKVVPAFQFTRANGATVHTDAVRGVPQLFFFGYTHCPDVCPTTLADWTRVKKALGDKAARVRFYFVTVDPERDTPSIAERYAAQFDSTFVGLSGDSITTSRMKDAFGITAYHDGGTEPAGYFVSHSSQVFLVDGKGRLVAQYPFGIGWEAMLADIKRFL